MKKAVTNVEVHGPFSAGEKSLRLEKKEKKGGKGLKFRRTVGQREKKKKSLSH